MCKPIAWLVEEAMAKTCTDEHAYKYIYKQRIELIFPYFLVLVEPRHYQVAAQKGERPA